MPLAQPPSAGTLKSHPAMDLASVPGLTASTGPFSFLQELAVQCTCIHVVPLTSVSIAASVVWWQRGQRMTNELGMQVPAADGLCGSSCMAAMRPRWRRRIRWCRVCLSLSWNGGGACILGLPGRTRLLVELGSRGLLHKSKARFGWTISAELAERQSSAARQGI